MLSARPRRRARHLQRHGWPDSQLQCQGLHLSPRAHGRLHRQGPARPERRNLGRQRPSLDQDLPGYAPSRREHDLAIAGYATNPPIQLINSCSTNADTRKAPVQSQLPSLAACRTASTCSARSTSLSTRRAASAVRNFTFLAPKSASTAALAAGTRGTASRSPAPTRPPTPAS